MDSAQCGQRVPWARAIPAADAQPQRTPARKLNRGRGSERAWGKKKREKRLPDTMKDPELAFYQLCPPYTNLKHVSYQP